MKRILVLFLTLASAGALFAQQVWEGSSAVSVYGVFPASGYYGASDSFPQNTLVSVEDLDTGKQATVLIIDRSGGSGLLLLVSKQAGDALGIVPGTTAHVRVTLAKQPLASGGPGDLPYSPDSDVYPAAGVGDPTSLAFLNQYLAKKGAAPAPAAPQAEAAPSAAAAAAPGGGPLPAPQVAELAPGAAAPRSAQAPVAAPAAPTPPAQPSESPRVVALQPEATPPVSNRPPAIAQLPEPKLALATPQVAGLSGSQPPAEAAPQLVPVAPSAPAGAGPALAQAGPVASELPTLVPPAGGSLASPSASPSLPSGINPRVLALAEPAPPVAGPEFALRGELPLPSLAAPGAAALAAAPQAEAQAPAQAPAPAEGAAPAAGARPQAAAAPTSGPAPAAGGAIRAESSLVSDKYYVQLGVFLESGSALNMASSLSPLYPVSVYAARKGTRELYKVLVGPLNSDEGGSVLYHFIDRGYRDAFLRKVD